MTTNTYDCRLCGKEFQAKRPAQFCCPAHRAAWHKQNHGVVPAKVQSISRTREGAHVVVVRVAPDDSGRIAAWVPTQAISLLTRDSERGQQQEKTNVETETD